MNFLSKRILYRCDVEKKNSYFVTFKPVIFYYELKIFSKIFQFYSKTALLSYRAITYKYFILELTKKLRGKVWTSRNMVNPLIRLPPTVTDGIEKAIWT